MPDEPNQPSFSGRVAAATAVVVLLTGVLTLWIKWDDWFTTKQSCSISGRVYSATTNQPVPSVRVGWSPYAREPFGSSTPVSYMNFTTIAASGTDGTFSGSCKGAKDNSDADTFMLVYTGGTFNGLPCLRFQLTYQDFSTAGEHTGVNIPYVC